MRIITFLFLMVLGSEVSSEIAMGTVFLDQNKNGILDPREKGLGNVRVSNGLDVVLTDKNGRYELPVQEETILFVVKPKNFVVPVNNDMLPQFYYIHQPNGSPKGLRYQGIAPTGELPKEVNFPLFPRPEEKAFEAILFADPQPQTNRELDFIRDDVVSELIGSKASFGMTMGDILFDDLSMFPRYNSIISKIGIPWYNVPGNHEINFNADNDDYSLETFKRFFGPTYYSFEYAEVLFVVLDNIEYQGKGEADAGDIKNDGGYETSLSSKQLKWLKNELDLVPRDTLVFIATHAPLGNEADTYVTKNRKKLFQVLAGRPNLYSVAGHTHTTDHVYFDREDGFLGPGAFHHHVLATVSGSWWSGPFDERGIPVANQRDGTPNGYHILKVDGTDLAVDFKAAGKESGYQMRIMFDVAYHQAAVDSTRDYFLGQLSDSSISKDEVPSAKILVNLFDGGPNSKVRYQINDRKFVSMEKVLRKDPHIVEQFHRFSNQKKSWVQATPSTHIFSAPLDPGIEPGTHTLTVIAIDEFGQKHHGHSVLEIVDDGAAPNFRSLYPGG